MPPKIQRSNAKHYKSDTITEVKEFEGPHLLPAAPGLGGGRRLRARLGARARRRSRAPRDRRPPHPHRRADGADRGRRLAAADRPDVRRPRPAVHVRLGRRRRASSPGRRSPPADLGPIDAVLLTHDHHGDNLDDAGRALLPSAGAVVTTVVGRAAARRRRARARAVGRPRGSRRPGRPAIEVTATPCRHGPPRQPSDRRRRDRLRAALGRPGARRAVDLRRHRALRRRARGRRPARGRHRRSCTSAACGSRVTGPAALHDDRRATPSSCAALVRPRTIVPVHYEGWSHFQRGPRRDRARVRERAGGHPPRVRWLPIGEAVELAANGAGRSAAGR